MVAENKVAVDAIVATSTYDQISIADAQRSKRIKPWKYVLVGIALLLVLTVPYGIGRHSVFSDTPWTIWFLSQFQPIGWALISWSLTVLTMLALALAVIESAWKTWGVVSYLAFAGVEYLSGLSILRVNYWWSTKVIFGSSDVYANGINAGIICAVWALGVFVAFYITTLVFVKKTSPLNILTRSWVAFCGFFLIEVGGLIVAMFGGMI
ncbi:hypothetical protein [Alloscardovia criceti]|uniref:hypothetical protein n=1 Tax=Alloscardovia criceti TaxID=356828 RepID=UPI00035E83D9|nr:hypothetical protein [Alloscardovia criceti]